MKFDKKYVHFLWDDVLKDKRVILANDIGDLIRQVENAEPAVHTVSEYTCEYPFQDTKDPDGTGTKGYKFAYYDPNYFCKLAYEQGMTIQARPLGCKDNPDKWHDVDVPAWNTDVWEYRVKTPCYRPYSTIPEGLIGKIIRKKSSKALYLIDTVENVMVHASMAGWCTPDYLLEQFEFTNGSPCGIKLLVE